MPSTDPRVYKHPIQLNIDAVHALSIFSNLVLASKHPQNVGVKRELTLNLVEVIGGQLIGVGMLTRGEVRDVARMANWTGGQEDLINRLHRVAAGEARAGILTIFDEAGPGG